MDRAAPPDVVAALLTAGYRVVGPAGVGADGPAWSAVALDEADERVVVHVVDLAADPRHAARLHRLREVEHEHLVRLRHVLELPDGRGALLTEHVRGASLAALRDARGPWTAGEAVTLAVPLADALDALHRAGLVHSDVAPANVVVRDDGRPVLVDLVGCVVGSAGTPGFAAPEVEHGRECDAAGDVHALARTVLWHLAEDPPVVEERWDGGARVRDVLAAATDLDPVLRPDARALADACFRAEEPEPVVLPDAAVLARTELSRLAGRGSRDATVRRASRRRARTHRRRRTVLAVAGGVAAVLGVTVVLGLAGVVVLPGDRAGRVVGAAGDPDRAAAVRQDAATAARELTVLRGQVLARGDAAALEEVEVAGSPAHTADAQLLARLAAEGLRLDGITVDVTGATVVGPARSAAPGDGASAATHAADAAEAHVQVTSATSAHRRVRADGSIATEVPATPARTVVLVLRATAAGWRVSEVREPSVSDSP